MFSIICFRERKKVVWSGHVLAVSAGGQPLHLKGPGISGMQPSLATPGYSGLGTTKYRRQVFSIYIYG